MSVSSPSVAVVILSWNGKHFLENYLPFLLKTTYTNASFYVIDNASEDGTIEYLSTHFPQVNVIALEKNLGFAGGYNAGLAQINSDYYVLLNQDVEVTPGWIEPVLAIFEKHPETAAVQPDIMDINKRDYFEYAGASGGYIDAYGYPFCRGRLFQSLEKNEGQYADAVEIFWATGACMFVKTEVYHEAGGLDQAFFAHMEEIDLCWRIRNMGYTLMSCPQSIVYHVGGGSLPQGNPRKTFLNFRNSLRMLIKNLPDKGFKRKIMFRLFLDLLAAVQSLLKGNFSDVPAIFKAHLSIFKEWTLWLQVRVTLKQKFPSMNNDFKGNGVYDGLLIWAYFLQGKRKFSDLKKDKF